MFPFFIFDIFGRTIMIPLYGLSILVGISLAALVGFFFTKKTKQDFTNFTIIAACTIAMGFLGAKLLFVALYYPPSKYLSALLHFQGGFIFYGGLILGPVGFIIGNKLAKTKYCDFLNILTFCVPLIHAFGRIGCFFAGCCWGFSPYEGPFALHYHPPVITDVPLEVGIFPVQLLESTMNLIVFAILFIYGLKHIQSLRENFHCTTIYGIAYSIIRFTIEFFRGDMIRGKWGFFLLRK